jgi:small subunit ribosomal protein S16
LPTDRVLRFLDEAGVMQREKPNNPIRALPRKERKARAEEAAKAAEEAAKAKAAAAAAKPA